MKRTNPVRDPWLRHEAYDVGVVVNNNSVHAICVVHDLDTRTSVRGEEVKIGHAETMKLQEVSDLLPKILHDAGG